MGSKSIVIPVTIPEGFNHQLNSEALAKGFINTDCIDDQKYSRSFWLADFEVFIAECGNATEFHELLDNGKLVQIKGYFFGDQPVIDAQAIFEETRKFAQDKNLALFIKRNGYPGEVFETL